MMVNNFIRFMKNKEKTLKVIPLIVQSKLATIPKLKGPDVNELMEEVNDLIKDYIKVL